MGTSRNNRGFFRKIALKAMYLLPATTRKPVHKVRESIPVIKKRNWRRIESFA